MENIAGDIRQTAFPFIRNLSMAGRGRWCGLAREAYAYIRDERGPRNFPGLFCAHSDVKRPRKGLDPLHFKVVEACAKLYSRFDIIET